MKRFALALLLFAIPAFASVQDPVFASYEQVRQALLHDSIAEAKSAAGPLASAKNTKIAQHAASLQKASDLAAARQAFAALSNEVIKYRDAQAGERPVVAYCPMVKQSWLQPKGEIGNPYATDVSMRKCGSITKQ